MWHWNERQKVVHFFVVKRWNEGIQREGRHSNPHFTKEHCEDNDLWVMTAGGLRTSTALPRVGMGTALELRECWMTPGTHSCSPANTPVLQFSDFLHSLTIRKHFEKHWAAHRRHPEEVTSLKCHKLLELILSPLPRKHAVPDLLRAVKALRQALTAGPGKNSKVSTASVGARNASYLFCYLLAGDGNGNDGSCSHKATEKYKESKHLTSKKAELGQFPEGKL